MPRSVLADGQEAGLNRALVEAGVGVSELVPRRRTLEELSAVRAIAQHLELNGWPAGYEHTVTGSLRIKPGAVAFHCGVPPHGVVSVTFVLPE